MEKLNEKNTSKQNLISEEPKKKKKGCLRIIFFIFVIYIIIAIIMAIVNPKKQSPINKLFSENKLGMIENKEEKDIGGLKVLTFEAKKIKYRAFLEQDGKIRQLFVGDKKSFPIINIDTNDTTIDDNELKIIERMQVFWDKSVSGLNGSVKVLNDDIKSKLKYPDTFKHVSTKWIDQGQTYYIIVNFTAKNLFGVPIPGVAKYTINFNDNKYTLEDFIVD